MKQEHITYKNQHGNWKIYIGLCIYKYYNLTYSQTDRNGILLNMFTKMYEEQKALYIH